MENEKKLYHDWLILIVKMDFMIDDGNSRNGFHDWWNKVTRWVSQLSINRFRDYWYLNNLLGFMIMIMLIAKIDFTIGGINDLNEFHDWI